jgi:hypothetical protein
MRSRAMLPRLLVLALALPALGWPDNMMKPDLCKRLLKPGVRIMGEAAKQSDAVTPVQVCLVHPMTRDLLFS